MKLSDIGRASKEIMETHVPVLSCGNEASHDDDLLPFFYSNHDLSQVYQILSINSDESRKSKLTSYISSINYVETTKDYRTDDDKRFFIDHNLYCYSEDTWTKRLYAAISFRYSDE